jgi:hypothetical protein
MAERKTYITPEGYKALDSGLDDFPSSTVRPPTSTPDDTGESRYNPPKNDVVKAADVGEVESAFGGLTNPKRLLHHRGYTEPTAVTRKNLK